MVAVRGAVAFATALLLAACGQGAAVQNQNLRNIDRKNFDGFVVSYFLPRADFSATAAYDPAKQLITITSGEVKISADINSHQHAVYRHDSFSNDEVAIEITQNGLLKSVTTTTADQRAKVVEAAGSLVQEIINLRDAGQKKSGPTIKGEIAPVAACPAFATEATINITDQRTASDSNKVDAVKGAAGNPKICELDVTLTAKRADTLTAGGLPPQPNTCPQDAVCFRLATGFTVTVEATLLIDQKPMATRQTQLRVVAPSKTDVGALYFNRRAFVKNSTTAEFSNGMLTKITTSDPSEIAQVFDLPIQVLKSLTILVKL